MAEENCHKMALLSHWGLCKYNVMPLGVTNAVTTFQRLMNSVLHEFLDKFLGVYLDDLFFYSKSLEDHMDHLKLVLDEFQAHKLYAKMSTCQFAVPYMEYLGHVEGHCSGPCLCPNCLLLAGRCFSKCISLAICVLGGFV